jgi:hypothetical protein
VKASVSRMAEFTVESRDADALVQCSAPPPWIVWMDSGWVSLQALVHAI